VCGCLSLLRAADTKSRAALAVLKAECFSCHGDAKQKGGLSLASRDALLKGGDEGPAAHLGRDWRKSPMLALIQPGADPHMPPRKQLDPDQIRSLTDWVRSGLAWDQSVIDNEEAPRPVSMAPSHPSFHPVAALAFSPDARRLAVARGHRLALFDLTPAIPRQLAVVDAHVDPVQSIAWSHDGKRVVTGAFRRVRFWSAENLQPTGEITNGLSGRIGALAFTPDNATLAMGDGGNGRPGWIRLFPGQPSPAARALHSWRAHGDYVYDVEFSRDGARLVSAGGDQLVKVWNATNRQEIAALEGHTAQVLGAAFNTNATRITSVGADRQVKVWDIATREKIISLGNASASFSAVAWPGDSSAVFAANDAGTVFRYINLKTHTGEQSSASGDERQIGTLTGAVLAMDVTADGSRIAAGSHDGAVHLWNVEGKLLAKLEIVPAPTPTVASANPAISPAHPAPPRTAHVSPAHRTNAPPLPTSREVVSLAVEPRELILSPDAPDQGLLVTATTRDGFEVDVTDSSTFKMTRGGILQKQEAFPGRFTALKPGRTEVRIRFAGRDLAVPVEVRSDGRWAEPEPSFVRDVLPALNQAGCASGGCHSKPEGQAGFKLSVFSYDPMADHAEITVESRGRRVFPSAPDESLLLLKPLGDVPHEGGRRFEHGSATHQLLVRWLRAGMPFSRTNEPVLQRISAFPRERRYPMGSAQRLLVQAHYSDGSVRDVTRLAAYDSNDKEMVRVDAEGRMSIGRVTGQAVVVARYMGFVSDSHILVPAKNLLPTERYAGLATHNFIDRLAYEQFQRLGLYPSETCSDAEFLRRTKLDAIGLLPTPDEVRAFLADTAPDKRQRFIERLLDDPAYADFWANQWADLLRPNPDRVGVKSVFLLDQWLREQFRANRPYDQFVRDILAAEGSNHRAGPAVVYRDRREPAELTTMFSQLFLGTRLECAKCHHHPNEKWGQEDFYQLAAYFGPVKQKGAGLSPPISAGTETFYFAPGGTVKHPVTGAVMTPRPPDGPAPASSTGDPRAALAEWLTTPTNPFFARAAVNRVWGHFFGRGLVHPVDDFRTSNPCVNPPLLDALAADFAAHGYDYKHLIRTILSSRLYQLSAEPNPTNLTDTRNFSRAYRRRLRAEVMVDAVRDVTGVPETFTAMPPGSRATQAWSYKIESHFLDAFGRPNSSSDCPCERDTQLSVVQSLHLMNSKTLQAKLADPGGRVRLLADSTRSPEEIISELYLSALGRPPSDSERRAASAAFSADGATRRSAAEDILWALLNSPEFVLNH